MYHTVGRVLYCVRTGTYFICIANPKKIVTKASRGWCQISRITRWKPTINTATSVLNDEGHQCTKDPAAEGSTLSQPRGVAEPLNDARSNTLLEYYTTKLDNPRWAAVSMSLPLAADGTPKPSLGRRIRPFAATLTRWFLHLVLGWEGRLVNTCSPQVTKVGIKASFPPSIDW